MRGPYIDHYFFELLVLQSLLVAAKEKNDILCSFIGSARLMVVHEYNITDLKSSVFLLPHTHGTSKGYPKNEQ